MVRLAGVRFALVTVLVTVLVSLLTGCFAPVFDLDTSLAYRTAGRMTKVATIGPMDHQDGQVSPDTDYYFLPSLRAFPDHGMFVVVDDLGAHIRYFAPDPADGRVREIGGDGFNRDGLLPGELDFFVSPLRNSAFDDAFFVARRREADIDLLIYRVDLTARIIDFPNGAINTNEQASGYAVNDTPVFASVDASDATPGDDTLSIFAGASGVPGALFREQVDIIDNMSVVPSVASNVSVPGGVVPSAAYAVYNTDLDLYVVSAWSSADGYSVFSRDSGGTVTELDAVERIDAILSDGRLYHRGETEDLVYTSTGELELTIPTGRLRFAYETAETPRTMIYTIAYFDDTRDDEFGNLFADVYSIETSQLATLE